MIGVDETFDPGYHSGGTEAVARGAVRVVFDVEHPGEGDAVRGPAPTVSEEEIRLCGLGFCLSEHFEKGDASG